MREKYLVFVLGLFACFVLFPNKGSPYVAQAGPKLLSSIDTTSSTSWEAGTTGMLNPTQLKKMYSAITQV
jgi:hypothetical protein